MNTHETGPPVAQNVTRCGSETRFGEGSSFYLHRLSSVSYDKGVNTVPEDGGPEEDINAQIDRFLAKIREEDAPAASKPAPAELHVKAPAPKTRKPQVAPVVPKTSDSGSERPRRAPAQQKVPKAPTRRSKKDKTSPAPEPVATPTQELPEWARNIATPASLPRVKKSHRRPVFFAAGAALLAAVSYSLVSLQMVSVSEGILTNLGPGDGRIVLVNKTTKATQGELVVGVMPGTNGQGTQRYVMGTVFSLNDETYAVYDGEVVWQVPISDLRGKVLFAQPAEFPGTK